MSTNKTRERLAPELPALAEVDVDPLLREALRSRALALLPGAAAPIPRRLPGAWLLVPYGALLASTGAWMAVVLQPLS